LVSLVWSRIKAGSRWFAAGCLTVLGFLLWARTRHRTYPRPVAPDPELHYPPPLPKSKAERDELLKKWKVVK
jgi:hypothetical protein